MKAKQPTMKKGIKKSEPMNEPLTTTHATLVTDLGTAATALEVVAADLGTMPQVGTNPLCELIKTTIRELNRARLQKQGQ